MHNHQSPIEIYGSQGSMQVPDPNSFGGPSSSPPRQRKLVRVDAHPQLRQISRGIAVADIGVAIKVEASAPLLPTWRCTSSR
jgi:hypothetical protein